MSWTTTIKKFDMYKKLPTELTDPTSSGAVISIIASELKQFLLVEERTEIIIDQNPVAEKMRINMDIVFPNLPCIALSLDQQDQVGSHSVNIEGDLKKIRLSQNQGVIGLFDPKKDVQNISVETIKEAFEKKEGCQTQGYIVIKRVPGNFHISSHGFGRLTVQALQRLGKSNLDLTHTINHLSFGDKNNFRKVKKKFKKGEINPIDGYKQNLMNGNYALQSTYYVNIIPSYFQDSWNTYELDQYTYSVNTMQTQHMSSVYFKYSIEPTTVFFLRKRKLFHFLVSISSFIGGVFIVAGLLDSFLHGQITKYKSKSATNPL